MKQKMRTLFKSSRQKGFTLTEFMIVMVLGGLVIAGVAAGVSRALGSTRSNSEIGDLQQVFTSIQKIYANKANYSGVTLTTLINLNAFPTTWVSGANVNNRWSGSMTVAAATISTANDALAVTSTGVPDYECKEVIPQLDGVTRIVTVNGTQVKANNAATDSAALGTNCAGGSNSIVYTIGK